MFEYHWLLLLISTVISALILMGIIGGLFCLFMYDDYEEHRHKLKLMWGFLKQPSIFHHHTNDEKTTEETHLK